jgi:hypothetical protein
MRTIVIYPGRFHPFHKGHLASYLYLVKQFGADNVYIATSGKQAPVTSPFSFGDKQNMMVKLGVPSGHIVQVKNPYQATEITDNFDPATTAVIFALSEKDAQRFSFGPKKDGSPSYMQPMPKSGKGLKPLDKHGYVMITPTVNFRVRGVDANSASQIRELYIKANDIERNNIIHDLYGDTDPNIKAAFDDRLIAAQQVQEFVNEQRRYPTQRGRNLLERVLRLEREARLVEYETGNDLNANSDYLEEARRKI